MLNRRLAAVVLACACLVGCSSVSVSTDYDREADFSKLTTFAWSGDAVRRPDGLDSNPLVKKRFVAAIERDLVAKGLRRTDASPEFLISLHTSKRDHLEATSRPGFGRHGWGGGGVDISTYTEGTLVVDFIATSSNELVWRGVARSIVDDSSGSPERVDAAVHALLENFPPK